MPIPGQPPQYSDTDFSVLQTAQDRLLEPRSATAPITIASTMWTPADLLGFLNYRVNRFLRETGLVVARLGYDGAGQDHSVGVTPNQEPVALPQNLVDVLRLAFVNYSTPGPQASNITEIPREDFLSFDADDQNWETTGSVTPRGYTQSITQTLQAFLANPPTDVGAVDITFVATGPTLTGLGVALPLPSIVAQYALYGLLVEAFSQEGEANNPQLAAYAEMRFEEGIVLAKALLTAPARAEAGFV